MFVLVSAFVGQKEESKLDGGRDQLRRKIWQLLVLSRNGVIEFLCTYLVLSLEELLATARFLHVLLSVVCGGGKSRREAMSSRGCGLHAEIRLCRFVGRFVRSRL